MGFLFARLPVSALSRRLSIVTRIGSPRSSTLTVVLVGFGLLGRMQDHRRLRVWKKAHALAIEVRRATREFPRTGYGSLQSQMIRAAESIVFNIVEGCGGRSPKEFARFLDISIKSTSELESQLELSKDYGVLSDHHWRTLTRETIDVRRMLCGLRAKVLAANPRRTLDPTR